MKSLINKNRSKNSRTKLKHTTFLRNLTMSISIQFSLFTDSPWGVAGASFLVPTGGFCAAWLAPGMTGAVWWLPWGPGGENRPGWGWEGPMEGPGRGLEGPPYCRDWPRTAEAKYPGGRAIMLHVASIRWHKHILPFMTISKLQTLIVHKR